MQERLDFDTLKQKPRAIRGGFLQTMGLRVHRAISWIGRAEASGDDHDARFLFLWIALNAAYADEKEMQAMAPGERDTIRDYFGKLVELDGGHRIYKALWEKLPGPVWLLMQNKYVFHPFWQYHKGTDGFEDWQSRFEASARAFLSAFQRGDAVKLLTGAFDRLYVLRNQLIHGGSTLKSSVNCGQVRDGAAIWGFLIRQIRFHRHSTVRSPTLRR